MVTEALSWDCTRGKGVSGEVLSGDAIGIGVVMVQMLTLGICFV